MASRADDISDSPTSEKTISAYGTPTTDENSSSVKQKRSNDETVEEAHSSQITDEQYMTKGQVVELVNWMIKPISERVDKNEHDNSNTLITLTNALSNLQDKVNINWDTILREANLNRAKIMIVYGFPDTNDETTKSIIDNFCKFVSERILFKRSSGQQLLSSEIIHIERLPKSRSNKYGTMFVEFRVKSRRKLIKSKAMRLKTYNNEMKRKGEPQVIFADYLEPSVAKNKGKLNLLRKKLSASNRINDRKSAIYLDKNVPKIKLTYLDDTEIIYSIDTLPDEYNKIISDNTSE